MGNFLPPFPMQAAGVEHGAAPVFDLLDDLLSSGVSLGAGGLTSLSVVQNPAGADMSVTVNPGTAYVPVAGGGKRLAILPVASNSGRPGALNSTDWLATFAVADATNPRIDRVVLTVRDSSYDGSGAFDAKLKVVQGTPTAGATLSNLAGAAAVPSGAILLANVLVAANATSIGTASIADVRASASVGGGGAGGFGKIWDSVEAGVDGGATTITTPTLPTNFKHLHVEYSGCSNQAGIQYLGLRFNGDTAAHYWSQVINATNTTVAGASSLGNAWLMAGLLGQYTGFGGGGFFRVSRYNDAVYHHVQGIGHGVNSTPNVEVGNFGGYWNQTNPITSLTFLSGAGGFGGNFRATVYGVG